MTRTFRVSDDKHREVYISPFRSAGTIYGLRMGNGCVEEGNPLDYSLVSTHSVIREVIYK